MHNSVKAALREPHSRNIHPELWYQMLRKSGAFILLCFFFSSRRRHTRCSRDWSSDVCSSDLRENDGARRPWRCCDDLRNPLEVNPGTCPQKNRRDVSRSRSRSELREQLENRSEERRVGKECRSRWSPYH